MQPRPHEDASDSEDDPDYVPPENGEGVLAPYRICMLNGDTERASSGDEDERDAKRQRTSSPQATQEEVEEKKRYVPSLTFRE